MTEQPIEGVKVTDLFAKDPVELLESRKQIAMIVEHLRAQREKFEELEASGGKKKPGRKKKQPTAAELLDKKVGET